MERVASWSCRRYVANAWATSVSSGKPRRVGLDASFPCFTPDTYTSFSQFPSLNATYFIMDRFLPLQYQALSDRMHQVDVAIPMVSASGPGTVHHSVGHVASTPGLLLHAVEDYLPYISSLYFGSSYHEQACPFTFKNYTTSQIIMRMWTMWNRTLRANPFSKHESCRGIQIERLDVTRSVRVQSCQQLSWAKPRPLAWIKLEYPLMFLCFGWIKLAI
jgi:hypothetical protein